MKIRSLDACQLLMRVVGWGMFLFFPLTAFLFPAGFLWRTHPESVYDPFSPYAAMLGAMYIALAIVLIRSSAEPEKHTAIFDYVIISSIIHGIVMLFQSIFIPHELVHLLGDVPLLFVMAWAFWFWHPKNFLVSDNSTLKTKSSK